MQKIDTAKIANGVKELIERRSTLKQMKGITNAELEAVYTLAFGYYRTGKFDEALKLFQFLVMFDHLNAKYWMGLGAVQQVLKDYSNAVVSYGYCSFLKLDDPRPQLQRALRPERVLPEGHRDRPRIPRQGREAPRTRGRRGVCGARERRRKKVVTFSTPRV